MTPSLQIGSGNWAVKSDSLLGYKTIDGKYYPREMTFTRATTGTRVNAAGLVEVVPYNLFSYSEDFTNAAWSVSNRILPVTSNSTIAPNGTLSADTITENTSTGSHYIGQPATIVGVQYNLSVYAKINGRNRIVLTEAGGIVLAIFNISNGTLVSGTGNIENVGNGWYRCSSNYTAAYTSATINLADDSNNISYTGNGTSGVYLWGAQLVEGTQPLTYLPTTDRLDIPRINYSTGSSALLLETQRTNLAFYSEQFNVSSYWNVASSGDTWQGTGSAPIITPNYGIAPNGTQTADRVQLNLNGGTTLSDRSGFSNLSFSVTSGVNYVGSYYIKILDGNSITSIINTNIGVLAAGTNPSINSYQDVGNGWYRVFKSVLTTTTTGNFRFQIVGVSGVNSVDCLIWGAQLELGAYATSYIPTTSASVTRNADTCTKTGISSLIGQTEGTIFLDLDNIPYNSDWLTLNPISGSPYTNGIGIGYFSSTVRLQLYSPSATIFATLTPISGRNKIAIGYKSGDTVIYINGVNVFSSAGTFSFGVLLDSITVGSSSWIVGSTATNKIYSHSLYNTRLTNSELIQLTTP
jgi:hypothetical protein